MSIQIDIQSLELRDEFTFGEIVQEHLNNFNKYIEAKMPEMYIQVLDSAAYRGLEDSMREFYKNSKDAGATYLALDIEAISSDQISIIVEDNGAGLPHDFLRGEYSTSRSQIGSSRKADSTKFMGGAHRGLLQLSVSLQKNGGSLFITDRFVITRDEYKCKHQIVAGARLNLKSNLKKCKFKISDAQRQFEALPYGQSRYASPIGSPTSKKAARQCGGFVSLDRNNSGVEKSLLASLSERFNRGRASGASPGSLSTLNFTPTSAVANHTPTSAFANNSLNSDSIAASYLSQINAKSIASPVDGFSPQQKFSPSDSAVLSDSVATNIGSSISSNNFTK